MSKAKVDIDNEYIQVTIGGANIWNSLFKNNNAPKSDTKNGLIRYIMSSIHKSWKLGMPNMVCYVLFITLCIALFYISVVNLVNQYHYIVTY